MEKKEIICPKCNKIINLKEEKETVNYCPFCGEKLNQYLFWVQSSGEILCTSGCITFTNSLKEEKKKKHIIRFEFNKNLKPMLELLNTIDEKEREFSVEAFLEMKQKLEELEHLQRFTTDLVFIKLDNKSI